MLAKIPSANGERQMFPRHTNRTEMRASDILEHGDSIRFLSPADSPSSRYRPLLTDPDITEITDFEAFGLSELRMAALRTLGWSTPTPIQRQAIPKIMTGSDVVGIARTGTGKTGAFMLPALELITKGRGLQVLVLCPTRELAQQVRDDTVALAAGSGFRCVAVHGGVAYGPQLDALARGDEIVVATPGRLIDLQHRGKARLKRVRLLILDEADRMLDMGFRPQITEVVKGLGKRPQTLLFSATMPNAVHDLALRMTRNPAWIEVSPSGTVAQGISEIAYSVRPELKPELLVHLLAQPGWKQVLVFARTKIGADTLKSRLDDAAIRGDVIHSDRNMHHRTRAIDRFTEGRIRVLVATDIAQRGLDIEGISHVVNYDVPLDPGDYVHRIGRTARAGATGQAVTFVTAADIGAFRTLENHLGRRLDRVHHPDFDFAGGAVHAPRTRTRSRSGRGTGSKVGTPLNPEELAALLSHDTTEPKR